MKKKTNTAKTQCPCGRELVAQIKKPAWFTPTRQMVPCECGSRFLMTCQKDKKKRGANFTCEFEIIRLSPEASKRSSNPIRQIGSKIVEKFGKREGGPEF